MYLCRFKFLKHISKMLRPNDNEEKQILELTKWIQELKRSKAYSDYITSRIERVLDATWENPMKRLEICSMSVEEAKCYLLEKFKHEDAFCATLNSRLESIRQEISYEVFSYYYEQINKYSTSISFPLKKWREYIQIGIELGLIPKSATEREFNYSKHADSFIQIVKESNSYYIQLRFWLDNERILENCSEHTKDYLEKSSVGEIEHALKYRIIHHNPFDYAKEQVLSHLSLTENIRTRKADIQIEETEEIEEIEEIKEKAAVFRPQQEFFYRQLEEWAKDIQNPWCKKWICDYLENGRQLPFHRIRVFKYIRNTELAKSFLIEQYERVLKFRVEKKQKYEEKDEKYRKRDYDRKIREFERLRKYKVKIDFFEYIENLI